MKDINICGNILSVLLDRNEVQVINLELKQRVFKATYRDATPHVSRLFYINQKTIFDQDDEPSEEELNRFRNDEVIGDEDVYEA